MWEVLDEYATSIALHKEFWEKEVVKDGVSDNPKIAGLYQIAKENGIDVYENCPQEIIGMAAKYTNEKPFIGLCKFDPSRSNMLYDEERKRWYGKLEVFAHEIGHCLTDSFYYGKESNSALICTQEAKADIWAFEYVLPFEELCEAVKSGCDSYPSLMRHFCVSKHFLQDAIYYYAAQNKFIYP